MLFYTICTISHLFQAEILVNSLQKSNPDAVIKIGLIDNLPSGFDKKPLGDAEIIEVHKLNIPGFDEMCKRYRIFELCFACKPYYALYFFEKYKEETKIVYVDTDIFVFSSFDEIEKKLDEYAVILTPHITQQVKDGNRLERHVLHAGLFNAGFFAVSRKKEAFEFLDWFAEKLKTACIGRVGDQVWLSLVPVFFRKVLIENGDGYNMAGWNVMHRFITLSNDRITVNKVNLVFYHYSGFNYNNLTKITSFVDQGADINEREDILPVLKLISQNLKASSYTGLKNVRSVYYNHKTSDGIVSKSISLLKNRIKKRFSFLF
jgi:hypothetical protein